MITTFLLEKCWISHRQGQDTTKPAQDKPRGTHHLPPSQYTDIFDLHKFWQVFLVLWLIFVDQVLAIMSSIHVLWIIYKHTHTMRPHSKVHVVENVLKMCRRKRS